MTPPFEDAKRKRRGGGHSLVRFDPSKHPRGPGGRFISTGEHLRNAAGLAGQNTIRHVEFAAVRRPAELSKLIGQDVRGFKHAASNQAMAHIIKEHGNSAVEKARGQKAISSADFEQLPAIIRAGKYKATIQRPFGPKRVEIHADVNGDRYTYVAEIRAGKRRLDLITMYKK